MVVAVAGLVRRVEMEPIQEAQERAAMVALGQLGQMVQHTQVVGVVVGLVSPAQVDQVVVGLEEPLMALLALRILVAVAVVLVGEPQTLVAMVDQVL